jgi:hypothetical protein
MTGKKHVQIDRELGVDLDNELRLQFSDQIHDDWWFRLSSRLTAELSIQMGSGLYRQLEAQLNDR